MGLRQAESNRTPGVAQDRLHVVASVRDADAGLGETGPRRRRRQLLCALFAAATGLLGGGLGLVKRAWPVRYVEAVRHVVYPGPRRRFRSDEIQRPGHWGG